MLECKCKARMYKCCFSLQEGGALRLEAQVQPARDPNLSIEWFKNGVQLATGEC